MPDSSTTATLLVFSLLIIMMKVGKVESSANSIGTRNVVIKNDFLRTRVEYSRPMMILSVLKFIAVFSCYEFDENIVHARKKFLVRIDCDFLPEDCFQYFVALCLSAA